MDLAAGDTAIGGMRALASTIDLERRPRG